MNEDKQKIRSNRLKARLSIKDMCVKQLQDGRVGWKIEQEKTQPVTMRRRRKTSQNFQSFEYMSTFKDQTTTQTFETLFKKLEKIGQGAQSQVYKCLQYKTGQLYAVKITKKKDLQLIENMRQCYQVLKQLNHECIIKGKYLFLNQKRLSCHLVEQLGQYKNLRTFINRHFQNIPKENRVGVFGQAQVANVLKVLFQTLNYMKQKGVCHRDIKPDNILYDPVMGCVKIIDFQLARMQRYNHQKLLLMSHVGTLHYRAPQSFQSAYGLQVDIWSLGVIAFQMIIGILPFKSQDSQETIKLICNSEIQYEKYNLPAYTVAFLSKLLQKNPDKRMTPKQALASPYMLKNMSPVNQKKKIQKCSSFDEESQSSSSQQERCMTPSRYYEMDNQFSFADTINQDMGVRFCNE